MHIYIYYTCMCILFKAFGGWGRTDKQSVAEDKARGESINLVSFYPVFDRRAGLGPESPADDNIIYHTHTHLPLSPFP